MATVIALRFVVLPQVEKYRDPIVRSIAQSIGQDVAIGTIEGDWRGLRPVLRLYDVQVHQGGDQQTLALDRVDTVLSWWSLIKAQIIFHLIELDGSDVEIRRDSLGTFWFAGKALLRGTPGAQSGLLDWVLAQEQIVVNGAQLTWLDEMRSVPMLTIHDVNLRVRSAGPWHRVELTGKPPAELASELTIDCEFFGRDIASLSGRGSVYATFNYLNLAVARDWVDLPLGLNSGLGVMRLSLEIEDRIVRRAVAEGDLVNVSGRFGADLDALNLNSLSGRAMWEEDELTRTVAVSDLRLETSDGMRLSPASVSLSMPRDGQSRTQLRVRSLELAPLAGLSRFLPFKTETRQTIARLQPAGLIEQLQASWFQAAGGVQMLEADGRFARIALRPDGKFPGFSGLSGAMSLANDGGRVTLKSENALIDYPQIFAEPMPFDYLNADARWQHRPGSFGLNIASLSFTNLHGAGSLQGTYAWSGDGRGDINLRAALVRGEAKHVWRYFPHAIEGTRNWLKQGLVAGHSDRATLHLAGPLDKFPFRDQQDGVFQISAAVRDAAIRIGEQWPLIEGVAGEFRLDGDRIDIRPSAGTIMGADVSQSRVAVLELGRPDVRVSVDGAASGEVGQYLRFVANSPVAGYTKGATSGMRGEGRGVLALRMQLPILQLDQSTVSGKLDLSGPVFQLMPQAPLVSNYAVGLDFDRDGFALRDGRAQMLGGAFRFASVAGSAGADGEVRFSGAVDGTSLATFLDLPVPRHLYGRTECRGSFRFGSAGMHLSVASTMEGMGSLLPPPLGKADAVALPTRFDLYSRGGGRLEYGLRLDGIGSARLVTENGEVDRGEIALGGVAAVPGKPGVVVRGELASFDYDGWRDVFADEQAGDPALAPEDFASLDVSVGDVLFGGRSFRQLRIVGEQLKDSWQIDLAGPQVKGDMVIRSSPEGGERINARFDTLVLLPAAPSVSVPQAGQSLPRAQRIPAALNVIVEAFEFEGKALGRLELLAEPDSTGWRLDRLAVVSDDGRIDVKGQWRKARRPVAEYTVRIEALDNGRFFKRLGYDELIVGGTGSLTGPVSWLGGPFQPDLPSLNGKLKLEAANGRFAQVDPGAAQLIGILSLQALPRRITLNFKDVFTPGFSFDRIDAEVTVSDGVARTENFFMQGVAAEVKMEGEINLVSQTQALDVHVRPMLSSAAAVAGAAIVNPLVGVATLLVQKALGDPVEQAASRDYRVTGSWGEPQVTRIERELPPKPPAAPGR